jgi:hypothetical protein
MYLVTRMSGAAVLNSDGSLALYREHFDAARACAALNNAHGHSVHVIHPLEGERLGLVMNAACRIADKEFTSADPDTWAGFIDSIQAELLQQA